MKTIGWLHRKNTKSETKQSDKGRRTVAILIEQAEGFLKLGDLVKHSKDNQFYTNQKKEQLQ